MSDMQTAEILFSRDEIHSRVVELGREISDFYRGKPLTVVVLMTGGRISRSGSILFQFPVITVIKAQVNLFFVQN